MKRRKRKENAVVRASVALRRSRDFAGSQFRPSIAGSSLVGSASSAMRSGCRALPPSGSSSLSATKTRRRTKSKVVVFESSFKMKKDRKSGDELNSLVGHARWNTIWSAQSHADCTLQGRSCVDLLRSERLGASS
jgi:hypothetical protein